MPVKVRSNAARLLAAEKMEGTGGLATGTVRALVSVFGNVDSYGERVVKGAFADTLAEWRKSGDPIPFIWSHQWGNPDAHIGWVPPDLAVETDAGLEVTATVDLRDPAAAKVYDLLAARRVAQFSFAFDVEEEEETDEEVTVFGWWTTNVLELTKLKLFECGPCLLGANEETDLLEVAGRSLTQLSRYRKGQKSGRAISAANRQRLEEARELIEDVLSSDDPPEENGRPAFVVPLNAAPAPVIRSAEDDRLAGLVGATLAEVAALS